MSKSKKTKVDGSICPVELVTCKSITEKLVERAKYLSEKLQDYVDVLDLDGSRFFSQEDLNNSAYIHISEFHFDHGCPYVEFCSVDKWDESRVIVNIATFILKKTDKEIEALVKAGYEAKYGKKEKEERAEDERRMAGMSAADKRQFKKYLELKKKFDR